MLKNFTLSPRRPQVEFDNPRLLKAEEIRDLTLPRIGECYTGEDADGAACHTSPVVSILDLRWTIDPRRWSTETLNHCLPTSWRFVETQSGKCFAMLVYNLPDSRQGCATG